MFSLSLTFKRFLTWFIVVIDLHRDRCSLAHSIFSDSLESNTSHTLTGNLRKSNTHNVKCKHICTFVLSKVTHPPLWFHRHRNDKCLQPHLIKVEQHFSSVQLISLQTHSLIHQKLKMTSRQITQQQKWRISTIALKRELFSKILLRFFTFCCNDSHKRYFKLKVS